jgi:hypothetical protein
MWPLSRIHALLGIRASMHIIFDPLDFIAKLASLVPKPKVNLTRFHGVFAPNSKHRIAVTPARRGKGGRKAIGQDKTPEERRTAMTGFCSCKTGIHAIHGNNLGTTIEKGIQHRCRNLFSLRWPCKGHSRYVGPLYRGSTGHRHNSGPSKEKGQTAISSQCFA